MPRIKSSRIGKHSHTLRYRALYLLCGLVLAGCASNPPEPYKRTKDNSLLQHWSLEGKVGIREQGRSQSAFISWINHDASFRIELYGPFGKGRTIIEADNSMALLSNKDGKIEADNASELFYKVTGITMPIERLKWWIRGLPSPDSEADVLKLDPLGHLNSFEQGGWRIDYLRHKEVKGHSLPEKLKVSNADYLLTMVIKSWQLADR